MENQNSMTIGNAYKKGLEMLKDAQVEAPAINVGVLLCHVLGRDKSYLFAHDDERLTREQQAAFFQMIGERCRHKPLQYITGWAEFMSLAFCVGPDVLIPRSDTEVLVEAVVEFCKEALMHRETIRILDVGTGSGCIAVSLAKYIHAASVVAVDISLRALEIAGQNAQKHHVDHKIQFLQSDLMKGISGKFDVIVSNPPYISEDESFALADEVRVYEPSIALFSKENGLFFYHRICEDAINHLFHGGMLAFEVGHTQGEQVANIMKSRFSTVKIIPDLAKNQRVDNSLGVLSSVRRCSG